MAFGQAINAALTTTGSTLTSSAITTASGQTACIGIYISGGAAQTISSVSDSNSNVYTLGPTLLGQGGTIYAYYCANIVGGAGHTFTVAINNGPVYISFIAATFTGRATSSVLDKSNTYASNTFLQSYPGASCTPSFAGEDLFALNVEDGSNGDETGFTAGSGWTIPTHGTNVGTGSSYSPMMMEYQANVSVGTYSGSYTTTIYARSLGIIMSLVKASTGGLPQQMMMGMG
jgi:hypothetical protein